MEATEVGRIKLGLEVDTRDLDRGLKSAEGKANNASASIGKTMKSAFAIGAVVAATKAIKNAASACIDLGSDLAEVQNVVDVTFPSMAEHANKFAESAAASFGLSETMAKRYTGTFGSMAEAFGFAEGEALSMAEALTGLAGDVASFYNISQDEAYTKLKSVFSGETETLKELGIVMTQSALDQYALANGFGKTTKAMTEQEKVSLRLAFVTDQLGNAAGDFSRTSGSWANQTRLLRLQFDSLKASLGQSFIAILTPVVKALNTILAKIVSVAKGFASFVSLLKGGDGDVSGMATGLESVADSSANAAESNSALAGSIKDVGTEAKKAMSGLASFDKLNNLSKNNTSSSSSGTGTSGAGAGFDTSALDNVGKSLDATEKKSTKLETAVKNVKKALSNMVTEKTKRNLTDIKNKLSSVIKDAAEPGKTVFSEVGKVFGAACTAMGKAYREHGKPAIENLSEGADTIATSFQESWDKHMHPVIEKFKTDFKDAVDKHIIPKIGPLTDAVGALGETFSEIWRDDIAPWIADVTANLMPVLSDIASKGANGAVLGIQALGTGMQNATTALQLFNAQLRLLKDHDLGAYWTSLGTIFAKNPITAKIVDKASGVIDKIKTGWANIKSKTLELKEKGGEKVKKAIEKVRGIWDKLGGSKVVSLAGKGIGKVKSAIEALKEKWDALKSKDLSATFNDHITEPLKKAWNAIADKINGGIDTLNKLPGVNIKAKLPKLAQGGYVKANSPQLAVIGDNKTQGEIVAPEGKMQAMADAAAYGVVAGLTPVLERLMGSIASLEASGGAGVVLEGVSDAGLYRIIKQQQVAEQKRTGGLSYGL